MKGSVYKRNSGTWTYMFDMGKDSNGKRRRFSKGGFKTKKECEDTMINAMAEFKSGGIYSNKNVNISVSEYLQAWLKDVKLKRRHRSYLNYESVVRNHIDPAIGHFYMSDVTPITMKNMFDNLFENKDITADLMSTIYKVLNIAFKKAVIPYAILTNNPVQYISLQDYTFEDKENRPLLSRSEAIKILKYLETNYKHTHYLVFAIAYHMGLRRGEILGLQVSDIDLNNKTMTISKQSYDAGKDGIQLVDLKTKSSKRKILIPNQLVDILRQHIEFLKERNTNHSFLIINSKDNPMKGDNISWILKKINTTFNSKYVRLHDFRALHATLLVEIGADYKSIQERLGHADLKTTMNQYVKKVTDDTHRKTLSLWEDNML